jgi:hypothetical protein
MVDSRRSLPRLIAIGLLAGVAAYALTSAIHPSSRHPPAESSASLETRAGSFELHPDAPQLTVRSKDGAVARDVALALMVDGAPHPLVLSQTTKRAEPDTLTATAEVVLGDIAVEIPIELRVDGARDALSVTASAPPAADLAGHTFAIQADMASDSQVLFVAGVGPVADRATITGSSATIDTEPHPIGFASAGGPITVDAMAGESAQPGEPARVTVTSPAGEASSEQLAELDIVLAATGSALWRDLADVNGTPTLPVHGRVTGAAARAIVVGRDSEGRPQVRARAGENGAFDLQVPATVVDWYASVEPGRASPVVPFAPGTERDLVLDVSPGGNVHVTVRDADTHEPLTARILFRGVDGTVDPSFGPDYRASGAGPVMDSLRGDVVTPMPSGRYRVAATKGIEWSVDAKVVDVAPGAVTEIALAPRHVVPTPGVVGCDLHVHARPSFDSPVTPEDRVLSLAAAGIDFAVPTEHNIVGDYTSAVDTLGLKGDMSSVTGVEVTTLSKGFGHFGVFPYPPSKPVPPFRHTNMMAIFRAVREGDPHRYFQLNHPRLPKGIGYFANIGLDPNGPMSRVRPRLDFDGIEVYNGYDIERPDRVEQVLRDYWALLDYGWRYTATGSSDSHRIQFHWAGYPRTMVALDPEGSPDADKQGFDPLAVVSNIMKGHAIVTSGPILELSLGGAHPGDEVVTTDETIRGHLRVRAAPWVDVSRVAIVVGQVGGTYTVAQTFDVPVRPAQVGPEEGALAEAEARTVRFDRDLEVPVGPENGWIMVIARGDRRMDDVLPFMPVPPLGFSNPVYVVRRQSPQPPFPGAAMPRGVP